MPSRILTVPNQLTFLRLAFLPVFLIAIEYERYDLALGILVAAGVSVEPKRPKRGVMMPKIFPAASTTAPPTAVG